MNWDTWEKVDSRNRAGLVRARRATPDRCSLMDFMNGTRQLNGWQLWVQDGSHEWAAGSGSAPAGLCIRPWLQGRLSLKPILHHDTSQRKKKIITSRYQLIAPLFRQPLLHSLRTTRMNHDFTPKHTILILPPPQQLKDRCSSPDSRPPPPPARYLIRRVGMFQTRRMRH